MSPAESKTISQPPDSRPNRANAKRYLVALAGPLLVAGAMQFTWPFFAQSPTSLFLIAVMFSAWFGGLGPGLLSLCVSLLLADYFFIHPFFALWPPQNGDIVYLVTLTAVGLFVSVLSELMQRTSRRAERNLESVRRAEETLNRSQEQLAGVISSAMDAIISVDEAQRIILFNAAAERMFLTSSEVVMGQPLDRFIPQRFHQGHHGHIKKFGETNVTDRAMGNLAAIFGMRANGEEFPIEASISQIEIAGKKVFTVILRDITERNRAELAAAQLSAIVASSADAIVGKDLQGIVTSWNAGAEQMFGFNVSEMLGQPITRIIPANNFDDEERIMARIRRGEPIAHFETQRIRKDGKLIDVAVTVSPIRDLGGQVIGASKIAHDITDRKRAEERFRLVVEAAPNAMLMVNEKGQMTLVNKAAEQLFGYRREELLGQLVDLLVPERYRSNHPAHRYGFSQHPSTRSMGVGRDLFGLRKDGTEVPIEIGLNPVQTKEGPFVLASIIDITERKRAELRFRQVIEHAPNGMVMVDGQGAIALVNVQIEKSFGYSRDELLGQSIEILVPQRLRVQHVSNRDSFIDHPSTRAMGAGRDLFGRRKDGSEFPVEIGLNPLETEQGVMVLGTIVDITERVHAEEERRASEGRLRIVTENARVGLVMVNHERRYTFANATYADILELPSADIVGQRVADVLPSVYEEQIRPRLDRAFSGERVTYEMQRLAGDRVRYYTVKYEPTEGPDAAPLVVVVITDITVRKRAEEELRESEEQLRLAVTATKLGTWQLDLITGKRSWSANARSLFGLPLDVELDNSTVLSLIHPDDRRLVAESVERALLPGSAGDLRVEFRIIQQPGKEVRWLESQGQVLFADGKAVRLIGTMIDVTERKHAEQTLDAERNLLRTLIDLLPDYIYLKDTESRFLACNDACARLMGDTTPAELVGKTDADFYPPEVAARLRADEMAVLAGAQLINQEEPFTHQDGSLELIVTTKLPIRDSTGKITGLMGYGRNVTAARQAEAALRESEARYRTLFENAPDGIVIADRESNYIDANTSICRMLGYAREELIGLHARDIVADTELNQIQPALDKINERFDYHREWQFRRKDASQFPAEVIATMMPDGNLLGMIRDITERKRAEHMAQQSEDRLDFALQVSETGAWDLNLSDHTAYHSLQHDRIFGYQIPLPEWTYEIFIEHVVPEDRERVDQLFKQAIADKGDWSFECRIQRRDGEVRWIWASGRHRFDENGVARRMSGIVQDITERKRSELEIQNLNEELEQRVAERTAQLSAANKELEAFSYSVSHDLRAPLRHINGFSQALLEDYANVLDDQGKGYLREVRGASQEMAQLIDDLLQLARVTRSGMHRETVDLSELAQGVIAELCNRDPSRNVVVNIEKGLSANGDKRLLGVMLTNLLANAWKFTSHQEQPQITFRERQQNGETVYFVRDNGAGFDMAYADKLFGAFQRLHTTAEFEGTGIGLATVQRIINRHAGRVWAEGAVNHGATFNFTLPEFKGERT